MSGTFPATPKAASVSVSSWTPTLISQGHDLTRQVRSRGGQRWRLKVDWSVMTRAQASDLYGFAVAQRGQYETFTYTPPIISSTRGTATTAQVDGASQTGRAVIIDHISGTLKRGDFIKFANSNKVYMLTADVADSGTILNIEPALVTSPVDNTAVTVVNVPFNVSFTGDIQELATGYKNFYAYSAEFMEVL